MVNGVAGHNFQEKFDVFLMKLRTDISSISESAIINDSYILLALLYLSALGLIFHNLNFFLDIRVSFFFL